jgi:mono/diheme cytochrome c family protein
MRRRSAGAWTVNAMKSSNKLIAGAGILLITAAALLWFLNTLDEAGVETAAGDSGRLAATDPATLQRGEYLARAGNCMSCHSARGGAPYAGGRVIDTPFGAVYTSNLTPDEKTGLGSWSSAHFWRALHNGRSKSGRLLYPAFPYASFTRVTREDSDALFAYLKSIPAVSQPNRPNALRFPYQSQLALAGWRALFFRPGVYKPEPGRNAQWNRGAYLTDGLGHCNACHTARNALGASNGLDLAGGLIPVQNWYAPSLVSGNEAGVAQWDRQSIVKLLKTGISAQASVSGPMAEVVLGSTQYLSGDDLQAMAQYLKELPAQHASDHGQPDIALMGTSPLSQPGAVPAAASEKGARLYEKHCVQCHASNGQGVANAYPALAGNRAVLMPQTVNLVQIVLNGGYAPATQGNPRPFGMPPFVLVLDDSDVAAVLTHIRSSWGNRANAVSPLEVNRIRASSGR